jgi:phytoene dehydrogenase-like protein
VTFDAPARELGIPPLQTVWPDDGLGGLQDLYTGTYTDRLPLFMVETTLKTTAFDPNGPQPNAAMILWTPMFANAFAPWVNTLTGQRFDPPGYYEYKQYLQNQQLAHFYQIFPALQGHVVALESGTPLTIRDYVAKPNGAFMSNVGLPLAGIQLHYWTGIDGLYQAGADIVGGADKAPMTGALAAAEMMKDKGMFVKYLKRIL